MGIMQWLVEKSPMYQLLRERLTLMSDRAHVAEVRVGALEYKVEELQQRLLDEKDKWTEYVAVLTNRPPVQQSREWFDQQQALALEKQARVREQQTEVAEMLAKTQEIRAKAEQDFNDKLPDFADAQLAAANAQREEYIRNLDKFFSNELDGGTAQ